MQQSNSRLAGLSNLSDQRLITWLTLAGTLLGLWIAVMQHGWVNSDGTLYLEVARRLAEGDWQGGLKLYKWPLFSWLTAQLHLLTGLRLDNAARLLTTLAFGVTTWGFLSLIKEAGGRRETLLAGAALLFSSPYIVGDVLPMIMRDQGYWAFYLLSLLYFMRYYRDARLVHALLWQGCAILATLFRVEALSLLLLLPLSLLFHPQTGWLERLRQTLLAYLLPLSAAAVLIAMALLLPSADIQHKLGRLPEAFRALVHVYHQISSGLPEKARLYGDLVLGSYLDGYAMKGLLLTLALALISKVAGTSTWLATALALGGKYCKAGRMAAHARTVFFWVAGINLLNLLVVLLTEFLLSGRFTISLAFIVLIFAAFSLAGLYRNWRERQADRPRAALLLLAVLLMTVWMIDNLIQRDATHGYEREAVIWVQQQVPRDARVYYDSPHLRYYASAPWAGRGSDWEPDLPAFASMPLQYDYLVLHVKHKQLEKRSLLAQLQYYRIIKEFTAGNGDLIVVLAAS